MADDIQLPGGGKIVETEEQPDASHRQRVTIADLSAALRNILEAINNPTWQMPSAGAIRVVPVGGAASGTTAGTPDAIGRLLQVGSLSTPLDSLVLDAMMNQWANCTRRAIT